MGAHESELAKTTIEGTIPPYEQRASEHAARLQRHHAELYERGVRMRVIILHQNSRSSLDGAMNHHTFVASHFILDEGKPVRLSLESTNPDTLQWGIEHTKTNLGEVFLDIDMPSTIEA